MCDQTERPLDSDKLGNKGQLEFAQLCGDDGLICNNSEARDRAGWDFIVDFPQLHTPDQLVDSRPAPISTRFQQKTLWADNGAIRFNLAKLEQLAKYPGPSFIFVIKYDNDLRKTSSRIIPILGDFLSRVLKKLREERAAGTYNVKDSTFSITADNEGEEIESTRGAIKAAIERHVGDDIGAYFKKKADQLESLGFVAGARELSFSLLVDDKADLPDIMLGLKPVRLASPIRSFETRFETKLEDKSFGPATQINFIPVAIDQCTVSFREKPNSAAVSLHGEMFKAPEFPGFPLVILIKTDVFDIKFKAENTLSTITFSSIQISDDEPALTPTTWHKLFTIGAIVGSGGARVDIRPRKRHNVSIPSLSANNSIDVESSKDNARLADKLAKILSFAGAGTEPKLSIRQLFKQGDTIEYIFSIMKGEKIEAPIALASFGSETDNTILGRLKTVQRGVFVIYIEIGNRLLVCAADVATSLSQGSKGIVFTSNDPTLREIDIIAPEDYEEFGQRQKGDAPLLIASEPPGNH